MRVCCDSMCCEGRVCLPSQRTGSSFTPHHDTGIWRLLGKLGDQARTLVEERLKYTDKQWAKQGLRAGYK